jgi:hypothetical protein
MDHLAMFVHLRCTLYSDGSLRRFHGASRREEVFLAQLRGTRYLLLRETQKRVQGTDSTCSHCGEKEEDLGHILQTPGIGEPKEKELCAGPAAALGLDVFP